jgi:GntR family transcriptional repressor for pyruvate dehydrogenase complex
MAYPVFALRSRSTVPHGVAQEIRQWIAAGRLGDGDRLASVEELARQFGVSRTSIREALQALAALGVVEIRHGLGTYIRTDSNPLDGFTNWIKQQHYALQELCELRLAVETTAARLASIKASAGDVEHMSEALAEMRAQAGDLSHVVKCDTRFHQSITQASRNRLLEQAFDLTHELLAEVRYRTLSLPGEVDRAITAHERILRAIERHDPDLAASAMREHLRAVEQDLDIQLP